MTSVRGHLREPYRTEFLASLSETHWTVTTLLRARSVYRGQCLDSDVERSGKILYAAVAIATIGTAVSAVKPVVGMLIALLTPAMLLTNMLYERQRDAFLKKAGTPVRCALDILGGIGELPAKYVRRVETRSREPYPDPFHSAAEFTAEEADFALEIAALYKTWLDEQNLRQQEAETYRTLFTEEYEGSLVELVAAARALG